MRDQWLFFAPRSSEKSRENFLATLESGYPGNEVYSFLTKNERNILGDKKVFYIWGNQKAKKFSWEKMNSGDYVAFYAKGEFVYVGRCILKKHSSELARNLWGNVPKKDITWEYTYFLDNIRPINISLELIKKMADYKDKMIVQGFMPINEEGMTNIINKYGSLTSFFDVFSLGINTEEFVALDNLSNEEKLTPKEYAGVDRIFNHKDIDIILKEFEQRNSQEVPEVISRKIQIIKRNQTLVNKIKQKFNGKCQICGFTFKKKNGDNYSEVAHIKPISSKVAGIDIPSNMIVLCPNHHKMLDLGNLEIISNTEYKLDDKIKRLLKPIL